MIFGTFVFALNIGGVELQIKKRARAEFTEGPVFFKILLFALPILASGVLQLLYNMADNVVVGKFSGDPTALAAVGSTGALTNLILNLLLGLAVGSGVIVSQYYGAKRSEEISKAVHTSMTIAAIGGIIFGVFGFFAARPLLSLMGTRPDALDGATLYLKIIFCGVPASSIFNYGASILRSIGDSKRPLIILATTGLANVLLNLFFVIVCKMTVDGVALATITSQYLSAAAVLAILMRADDCYKLELKKLSIDKTMLLKILRVGIPSGINGMLFSFSNVMIQSSINTFPTEVVSGNTAAASIDGFTYTVMNSFYHAALTFTGQNYGARKIKRIYRIFAYSIIQVTIIGLATGYFEIMFAEELAWLFVDKSAPHAQLIVNAAVTRLELMLKWYFLCGIMEVFTGHLRGLGYSIIPMFCSLFGACVFRIAWITFVFPLEQFNTQVGLFMSFPLSWILTIGLYLILFFIARSRLNKSGDFEISLQNQ